MADRQRAAAAAARIRIVFIICLNDRTKISGCQRELCAGSAQEQFGCGVSEAQSLASELETVGGATGPAPLSQCGHVGCPVLAQVMAGDLLEQIKGPTSRHSQAE